MILDAVQKDYFALQAYLTAATKALMQTFAWRESIQLHVRLDTSALMEQDVRK